MKKKEILRWRHIKDLSYGIKLVEQKVPLRWYEISALKNKLTREEIKELTQHLTSNLTSAKPSEAHILVNILLMISAYTKNHDYIFIASKEIALLSNPSTDILKIVEHITSFEPPKNKEQTKLCFYQAAFLGEIGLEINKNDKVSAHKIVHKIATYLQTLSSEDNPVIRLTLIYYLSRFSNKETEEYFTKIMNRFGFTVLNNLFQLLIHKKNGGLSLSFLFENLPFMLAGERNTQQIIHENFKTLLLRNTEKFCLFLTVFTEHICSQKIYKESIIKNYSLQIKELIYISARVNNQELLKTLVGVTKKIEPIKIRDSLFSEISEDQSIRQEVRDIFKKLAVDTKNGQVEMWLRNHKKGRKPSFAKPPKLADLQQIIMLGNSDAFRLSA